MAGKKRSRFRWGWVWAALLVVGGGGYGAWYQQNAAAQAGKLPAGVQTGTVSRGDIDQKITATGVVAAQIGAKVNVGSQISGLIRSLPADVGALVRTGQVVAVLDSPDLQAQVEQQRQSVQVAEASLAQAESRLRQAELNAELTREQNQAQIAEARSALLGADERLSVAESLNKLQPTQTSTEIARARAGLSTAHAQERQVQKTVAMQIAQADAAIDEARVASVNSSRQLQRQQSLLSKGYIARQEVENTRTAYVQAEARLKNARASRSIVEEKTQADLQAARNQVTEAEAALEVAQASQLQNEVREAEARSALQSKRQAEATLQLRRSNRTQDIVRRRAVEEAKAAVAQARGTLRQAQAQLRFQEAQLDKAIIRAPLDGTVVSITAQQGETVAAGFQTATLLTVVDLKRLEVRAYVDEVDVGKARIGLPAEVRVESFPGRVFTGQVAKISSASTVKDNVVTYETTVALDNPEGLLRPDMTADVTLLLDRTPNVLLLPTEAIHREVGRTVVYVLHRAKQGKERVEERTVETGVRNNSHTQIVSGLKEGEEVVLAGLARLGVKAVDAQDAEGKKEP
ncbi:MAG: efflux RND transporter periplasmic adaptor subunit [Armatimonadota bacterium]